MTGKAESARPAGDTLVTVTFTEKDGRTIQSFHQAGPRFSARCRNRWWRSRRRIPPRPRKLRP